MEGNITYTVTAKGKVVMGCYMAFITIVVILLAKAIQLNIPTFIFVIFGIFGYVSSLSSTTLTKDALIVKTLLGKGKTYPLDSGEFAIKRVTGLKAWISFCKPQADGITYQALGASQAILVANGLYDTQDIEGLYQNIQKRKASIIEQTS